MFFKDKGLIKSKTLKCLLLYSRLIKIDYFSTNNLFCLLHVFQFSLMAMLYSYKKNLGSYIKILKNIFWKSNMWEYFWNYELTNLLTSINQIYKKMRKLFGQF